MQYVPLRPSLSTTEVMVINPKLDRKTLEAASFGFPLRLPPHGVYIKVAAETWLRDGPLSLQQEQAAQGQRAGIVISGPNGTMPPDAHRALMDQLKRIQEEPTNSITIPPAAAAPAPPPETPEERNERIMRITRDLSR